MGVRWVWLAFIGFLLYGAAEAELEREPDADAMGLISFRDALAVPGDARSLLSVRGRMTPRVRALMVDAVRCRDHRSLSTTAALMIIACQ